MKYYSEEFVRGLKFISNDSKYNYTTPLQINVRFCRDCEYFVPSIAKIDMENGRGYCGFRTNYNCEEDWPIEYYFCNKNSFCNEDEVTG